MEKVNLVYSADYKFQVIMVLPKISLSVAWDTLNDMAATDQLKEGYGIDHYDIVQFSSIKEMNIWIKEQVKLSRE